MMQLVRNKIVKELQETQEHHDGYVVFYVLKGTVELTIKDQTYQMVKSDIIVVNPWENYCVKGKDVLLSIFKIDAGELYKLVNYTQKCILCNTLQETNENFVKLRKLLDTLINTYFEGEHSNLFFHKASYDLVSFLITEFSNNTFLNEAEDERRYHIDNYLRSQYQEDLSLAQIAEYFHLSPQYFSKYFKELFGCTFSKYLHGIRLEHACYDLLHSDTTILKIALDNGFPNVTSFVSCFSEQEGTSPSKYRELHKKKETKEEAIAYDIVKPYLQHTELEEDGNVHLVHVSCEEPLPELDRYWSRVCNLGNLSSLSNSDCKTQIHTLQKELGFEFARVTLDTLKATVEEDMQCAQERSAIDLLIQEKFKILLSINYREFGDETYLPYLEKLLYLFINRYGFNYVASWKLELFYDSDFTGNKAQEYHAFYKKLYTLLQKIGINHHISGPGLLLDKEGQNLRRFLEKATLLQELSLSIAPYSLQRNEDSVFVDRSTDTNYILNQYELAKKIIVDYPRITSIQISSWKDSLNDVSVVNDSCYRAASIMKHVIQAYGILNSLPIDKPLDLMFQEIDNVTMFSGLAGLLSVEGIHKPSFYAYKFLKNLDRAFVYKDDSVLVSNDNTNYFQIVCHNYKKLNYKYYTYESNGTMNPEINEFFEDDEPKRISFLIEGLSDGEYVIKERTVNQEKGSALDNWNEMGFTNTSFFGPDELDYLKSSAKPFIQFHRITVTQQKAKFECTLQANEIKHLHLIHVH